MEGDMGIRKRDARRKERENMGIRGRKSAFKEEGSGNSRAWRHLVTSLTSLTLAR